MVAALAVPALATPNFDWAMVGDPGNAADANGYGAVSTSFLIMRYEFTNQQYAEFLNSVAATDTYSLFNPNMGNDARGGITRSGESGAYTYAVKTSMGQKPVNYVSWVDAARVANWLQNGATRSSSTETGAYTLNGLTSGNAVTANSGSKFRIPTENEWYKAAFYSPKYGGAGVKGYYRFATQSDSDPGNIIGHAANQANYYIAPPGGVGFSVTEVDTRDDTQNYLTDVGAFSGSGSFYGTFDQSGNLYQWNDLDGTAESTSSRGLRGGASGINLTAFDLSYSNRLAYPPESEGKFGFRLAGVCPARAYKANLTVRKMKCGSRH